MRFRHRDGTVVHLSYCTNVHPAEDLAGIRAQLADCAEPVRERLGTGLLGLGLWLPHDAATALAADPAAPARLRADLTARGLEVVSLNGFPYEGFHAPVVKHAVYSPDWADPRRLAYTLDLARVLAELLPDDAARGSVSTLPFGWRTEWTAGRRDAVRRNLETLAEGLRRIEAETGRRIRVGLEPEPGCAAETVRQALDGLAGTDHTHLGLCLDACHLAVAHEDPAGAVADCAAAGVPVVKLQASAALQADRPRDPATRAALAPFAEPRFLHQTREAGAPDTPAAHRFAAVRDDPAARDDLPQALDPADGLPGDAPWRIHYHVPLHADPEPPLRSTRSVLSETLHALFAGPRAVTDHVEVETYTWSVLPEDRRPGDASGGLPAGIAAELDHARRELTALGLRQEDHR
ncbi:metabolite traffic protein EboE [Streptomyces olivoreticuli]